MKKIDPRKEPKDLQNPSAKEVEIIEICLSDPRKSAPERMKTVIRQPVTGIKKPSHDSMIVGHFFFPNFDCTETLYARKR